MDTLTSRAERALLGAILLDPKLEPELRRHVEPADLKLIRHRMLYAAFRETSQADNGTQTWLQAVASHAREDVTADYLRELAAACPDPRHGPAYAALVLEAHFQRSMAEVAADAGALAETISYDAARLTQARSPGAHSAAVLAAHADQTARVIGRHAATFSPDTAYAPAGLSAKATGKQDQDEEHVLGAIINGHHATRQILVRIGPAAFRDPLRREVFTAILAADASGHAIDPLTVDWELTRARAWRGDNGQASKEEPRSYATRLAQTAPAGEILPTARALAQRQPRRAAAEVRPQAPIGSPRMLQPPPELRLNGQIPGQRR